MLEGDKESKFSERKAWVKSDEKHIQKVMTELIVMHVLGSRLWFCLLYLDIFNKEHDLWCLRFMNVEGYDKEENKIGWI